MVFPIVLYAVFFAFGDLLKADGFNKISLAVVERDGLKGFAIIPALIISDRRKLQKDLFTIAVVTEGRKSS